jgi:hypothetical protein
VNIMDIEWVWTCMIMVGDNGRNKQGCPQQAV